MEYSRELVEEKVKEAVAQLLKEDHYLLQHDLHERTISHKLACYLQEVFPEHNVDCEYNKNVDENYNPKKIRILEEFESELNKFKERLEEIYLKRKGQEFVNDILYSVKSVYPDIIVHRRDESSNNLLIIEIKKINEKNSDSIAYDEKKLISYTDPKNPNNLKYKYGVLIKFNTKGENLNEVTWRWFEKGEPVSQEIKFIIDPITE